ncbi:hypothetical protein AAHS21_15265 [Mycobacterium sp. 050272]|uniref:hypothetical protein n=1 Tax=Mycobacterium sp. 050272 TaxID=3142488 RepID=UPI00318D28B0
MRNGAAESLGCLHADTATGADADELTAILISTLSDAAAGCVLADLSAARGPER